MAYGFQKYRVRSPVKSFRDLEVYQITTALSADIFNMKIPQKYKKDEKVQVFYCKHCRKKFTPLITVGKTYPVAVILQSLILRNKFYSIEAIKISLLTIAKWIKEYEKYAPFARMRDYLEKKIWLAKWPDL